MSKLQGNDNWKHNTNQINFVKEAEMIVDSAGFAAKPPSFVDSAAYAKAEGLPSPVMTRKRRKKRAAKRRLHNIRIVMRLGLALMIAGLALLLLFVFNLV